MDLEALVVGPVLSTVCSIQAKLVIIYEQGAT